MFKNLDPLLHSQLRLAIMSLLMNVENADFVWIKEKTQATAGNLSVQIDKLSKAKYIKIKKKFKGKYPQTICSITETGKLSFENYIEDLKQYINI